MNGQNEIDDALFLVKSQGLDSLWDALVNYLNRLDSVTRGRINDAMTSLGKSLGPVSEYASFSGSKPVYASIQGSETPAQRAKALLLASMLKHKNPITVDLVSESVGILQNKVATNSVQGFNNYLRAIRSMI